MLLAVQDQPAFQVLLRNASRSAVLRVSVFKPRGLHEYVVDRRHDARANWREPMDAPLPTFRYHPDTVDSGSLRADLAYVDQA